MSNATQDAAFVRELVQGVIVENYIGCATLAVLVYDSSKPSPIYANLSNSELVLSIDKEVRLQVQLWSTRAYSNDQGGLLLGIVSLQVSCS